MTATPAGQARRREAVEADQHRALHQRLGALTGNQAMQQVKAGLKAIYLSGWQVAGDANSNGEMYPDQSLYAVDSVPKVVRRINNTFKRADEIQWSEGKNDVDFFAPHRGRCRSRLRRRAERLRTDEGHDRSRRRRRALRRPAGQVKKCGHMGGKVLVPTREAVSQAGRRPPGGRRDGRAHRHGRAPTPKPPTSSPATSTTTTSPSAPASAPSKASTAPTKQRPRAGDQPRPGLRAVRRPGLVRDRQARPGLRQGFRRRHPRQVPGKLLAYNCSPSRSTGRRTSTTPPSPSSSASWARWATSSSSSRWPASTA